MKTIIKYFDKSVEERLFVKIAKASILAICVLAELFTIVMTLICGISDGLKLLHITICLVGYAAIGLCVYASIKKEV